MRVFGIFLFMFFFIAVHAQSWEQPVWMSESPQFVSFDEELGYTFQIIKEKKSQELVFFKDNSSNTWSSKLTDSYGRNYYKDLPEGVTRLVYCFQDIRGGVYLIAEVSQGEIIVCKLLSTGFSFRKKACISGNGFTAFLHDQSTGLIYASTRLGGLDDLFSSLVVFNGVWKRKEETGKNAWHCFYEDEKGIKKETQIKSKIVDISRDPRGVLLLSENGASYLLGGKFKFGKESLGQRDTFECKEISK